MANDYFRTPSIPSQLLTALRATVVFLVLCGLIYTSVATFLGGLLFPHQATGSLIERNGQTIGSSLVGQPFESTQYFYGRPSSADYDPTATAGSNLAPSNPELRERVSRDSEWIQAKEGVNANAVPVDLVAASGAGLDPNISPEAAELQAPRVAEARGIPVATVRAVIKQHTQGPQWGLFGQPRVNVLELNLALDAQQ
ncbi:potassium-transporting ATPase subunit KdpC [Shewanella fodinae]|uniref:Potassium-transporting ATPase KdpC subunit n=1 Tax=Shewanella fodinae TaxID=552357 RepID=A0A4V2RRD3_9GAMM|nr:potassium-transporting ATPase subunit KdpC [Shewanella fodinae]TCN76092.1 K+-transporting ATPase ATPase C chain [Shewanella fodinae]